MKISMFGLGYVGCVNIACFSKFGYHVIGTDISSKKVDLINKGKSTIIEKDVDDFLKEGYKNGLIEATLDYKYAVMNSDISFICVGTPSTKNGHLNLDNIFEVAKKIGESLKNKDKFHVIAIRSTVLPGTNKKVGNIIEEISGKVRNKDFAVVSNPEFLREGSAVQDFLNPPLTLIGTDNEFASSLFEKVYKDVSGEFISTDIEVAEIMKYINNAYHALKIDFGNEVGNICKALNIDSHKVMEIFCKDKQLNISPYYFKPGFAYGGSCLPKDTKALSTLAHDNYISVPVIDAIAPSNEIQKKNAVDIIENKGKKKIAILGLSFKSGTDDLRCSPIVDVIEVLLGKGYEISIYDKNVSKTIKTNTNDDYIVNNLPHLYKLINDNIDDVINFGEVIVITNKESEFEDIPNKYPNKILIDLVRQYKTINYNGIYEGISWGDINNK